MDELLDELSQYAAVETDVEFSKMTTLRIGGKAKYIVYPETSVGFDAIMRTIQKYGVPYKMLGKGSNILCSDDPFDGVVIRLDRHFDEFYFRDDGVVAQAGCSIITLAYEAMKNGLSGLEFASGIPATVGGVTYMNAGAYKSSMSDIIEGVFVYRSGRFEWMSNQDCRFSYRTSVFQEHPDWIVTAVQIRLKKGDPKEISDLMASRRERRLSTQPLDYPSAGSVFRNPDTVPAWKLIEGIGYRGKKVGGAMVSEKHLNFIINSDHATARDFWTLASDIQTKVKAQYGIELRMEVEKFNWR